MEMILHWVDCIDQHMETFSNFKQGFKNLQQVFHNCLDATQIEMAKIWIICIEILNKIRSQVLRIIEYSVIKGHLNFMAVSTNMYFVTSVDKGYVIDTIPYGPPPPGKPSTLCDYTSPQHPPTCCDPPSTCDPSLQCDPPYALPPPHWEINYQLVMERRVVINHISMTQTVQIIHHCWYWMSIIHRWMCQCIIRMWLKVCNWHVLDTLRL